MPLAGGAQKERRPAEIRAVVGNLPPGEAAVYLDEVDVHLNPKVGPDWMNRGTQKQVRTPGTNEKRSCAARWTPAAAC